MKTIPITIALVSLFIGMNATFAQQPDKVCAVVSAGTTRDIQPPNTTVQICDKFYDKAPLVHLPGDDNFSNANNVSFYGAIDNVSPPRSFLADRTGQKWLVLNAHGQLNQPNNYSAFPASMKMPSNIYLYLLYHFQGKIVPVPPAEQDENQSLKGIVLSSATPIIYVPGKSMDNYLLGTWEGSINLRINPAPTEGFIFFDKNSTAPIRATFSEFGPLPETPAAEALLVWPNNSTTQKFKDVTVSDAYGIVENLSKDVVGSDGNCFKAFSSLGNSNPLLGATSDAMQFYRFPSMHGGGSEAMVMEVPPDTKNLVTNLMSVPFFMKASTLILENPQYVANEFPHSLDNGFRINGFHKVTGGGGACPNN